MNIDIINGLNVPLDTIEQFLAEIKAEQFMKEIMNSHQYIDVFAIGTNGAGLTTLLGKMLHLAGGLDKDITKQLQADGAGYDTIVPILQDKYRYRPSFPTASGGRIVRIYTEECTELWNHAHFIDQCKVVVVALTPDKLDVFDTIIALLENAEKLIVIINKMDTSHWTEYPFVSTSESITKLLRLRLNELPSLTTVRFIPTSVINEDNLVEPTTRTCLWNCARRDGNSKAVGSYVDISDVMNPRIPVTMHPQETLLELLEYDGARISRVVVPSEGPLEVSVPGSDGGGVDGEEGGMRME